MKKYKLPKELTLDYKKWVCGPRETNKTRHNSHGKGISQLENSSGYRCCLGQFISQSGFDTELMYLISEPIDLDDCIITGLSKCVSSSCEKFIENTKLSLQAMDINDSILPIVDKIKELRKIFSKHGYTIKLKNFPEFILKELD